nr:hypothetical transcript [Hymenolepis microstoma]
MSTDGIRFSTISSPYAVIPALPSGLPICEIFDQDTFFAVSSKFENNHYLCFCDETAGDSISKTNADVERGGKSFSADVSPVQSPDGDGAKPSLIASGISPTSSSSTPSATLRLSSSCPLSETMSWAISDRSLQKNSVAEAEAHRVISDTCGLTAISDRMCREWFQHVMKLVILLSKTGIVVDVRKFLKMKNWRRAILSKDSCQTQEELSESLDVAPPDFHLFRSMARGLTDQHFSSCEAVKNWIDSWILSKDERLLRRGFASCPRDGPKW